MCTSKKNFQFCQKETYPYFSDGESIKQTEFLHNLAAVYIFHKYQEVAWLKRGFYSHILVNRLIALQL